MKLRKIITMGLAAIMAVSVMSMTAFAKEEQAGDTWEQRWENAEYGTVESLDELGTPSVDILGGASTYGLTNPPSDIAGSSDTYFYDNSGTTSSDTKYRIYTNKDTSFRFNFDSNCTTSTTQYAEFFIAAGSSTKKIYFEGSGGTDSSVKITMVPMSSGSTLGPKTLPIHSSNYDFIYFNNFKANYGYAIKVTPTKAGKAISGVIKVSGSAFD